MIVGGEGAVAVEHQALAQAIAQPLGDLGADHRLEDMVRASPKACRQRQRLALAIAEVRQK